MCRRAGAGLQAARPRALRSPALVPARPCAPGCVPCRPAAHIPLFLYPFLNTSSKTRPFEYLRLTSLGVIGALVKVRAAACRRAAHAHTRATLLPHGPLPSLATLPPCTPRHERSQVDDTDVINFLLSTEIIPLCLRTMEIGSELSKTVATFIVQKILLDDVRGGACACMHAHARARARCVRALRVAACECHRCCWHHALAPRPPPRRSA